jgi:hypothetical protein
VAVSIKRRLASTALAVTIVFGSGLAATRLSAKTADSALSEAEVDQIREARLDPAECIAAFVKFLDVRAQKVQDLYAHPRRPGREDDTRELLEQFASIADELGDNLDDYGPRHADLRKVLPKLLQATERWATALKTPPEQETYSIERKFALESINDLCQSATELVPQQEAWFKVHPPLKKERQQPGPIEIPR